MGRRDGCKLAARRGRSAIFARGLHALRALCGGLCIASVAATCVCVLPGSGALRWSTGLARGLARSVIAGKTLQ